MVKSAAIHISQGVQQRHSPARIPNLFEQNENDPGISAPLTEILIPKVKTTR